MTLLLVALLTTTTNPADMPTQAYEAFVQECYDADTCTVTFHLRQQVKMGFGLITEVRQDWPDQKLRFFGINAPELRGDERPLGLEAAHWLRSRIEGKYVRVFIPIDKKGRERKGKYGRWLAFVFFGDLNLNQALIDAGHAKLTSY